MRCPVDGTTLLLSERNQVEIDYCPECRGVWLDRGELDKLVDREQSEYRSDRSDRSARDGDREQPRKKKKGFLSEMFEFGGD